MGIKQGMIIAGYQIERRLGSGAMSLVYLAKNRVDQYVAIKVLPENLAVNELSVKRFEREARLSGRLNHPHIVRVLDFFYHDGLPCLVLQYMSSGTLTQYLAHYPQLSMIQAVDVLRQIAEALDYAHSLEMIHRDIKTDNILLYDSGQVALSDFGLARAAGEMTLTNTGAMMGTPYYMSPEQIQPHRYTVDHRTDLYALGVLAYLLLTGKYPLQGRDAAEIIKQQLVGHPLAPTEVNASLPAEIDPIVLRMLAKDPDTRYENARIFVQDLLDVVPINPDAMTLMQDIAPQMDYPENRSLRSGLLGSYISTTSPTAKPDEPPRQPFWKRWIP